MSLLPCIHIRGGKPVFAVAVGLSSRIYFRRSKSGQFRRTPSIPPAEPPGRTKADSELAISKFPLEIKDSRLRSADNSPFPSTAQARHFRESKSRLNQRSETGEKAPRRIRRLEGGSVPWRQNEKTLTAPDVLDLLSMRKDKITDPPF